MIYLGYHAAVSYDKQDRIFVGTVFDIADSISFHAETKSGLQATFHRAINSYLEMCWMFGKEAREDYWAIHDLSTNFGKKRFFEWNEGKY